LSIKMEKKDIYIGYVGELKTYDSGVRKYSISFRSEQLDELKQYLTQRGSVNIDFVIKTDDSAFMSVFNPNTAKPAGQGGKPAAKKVTANDDDLPF
jgi:hypothetical protein